MTQVILDVFKLSDNTETNKAKFSDGGNGGSHLEARVAKLETEVSGIKTDLAIIKETMATDSRVKDILIEMHANTTKTICWLIGSMVAISSLAITIAKFIF